MTLSTAYVDEPRLLFGKGGKAMDPRIGMLNFGPSGLETLQGKARIHVGAIGSNAALTQLRGFLSKLMQAWAAPAKTIEKPWSVNFPGLGVNGPLGFEFELDRQAVQIITDREERDALQSDDRRERIEHLLTLYETKLADLAATAHPLPPLVILPISEQAMERCKEPRLTIDKIVSARRNVPDEEYDEELITNDFHNALKVLTFQYQIPCQLLRPSTLMFSREMRQDAATMAWNISSAMYYKATGHPWKLAQMEDATCIVGISFYKEISADGSSMRASMAQVYVRDAESHVIRGKPFKWEETRRRKAPTLTADQAKELLSDVLVFFRRLRSQEGRDPEPQRVVVHKTSPFTEDERAGFDSALGDGPLADYVHIADRNRSVRFYHEKLGYPPVRGTLISDPEKNPTYLYTVGFVPALRTYPGSTVPSPLEFNTERLDTSREQVAKDLMALTKLDWNSTDFCSRLPVTISVSRKVGRILSEARARSLLPPSPYRFYM